MKELKLGVIQEITPQDIKFIDLRDYSSAYKTE
jgi:hypothetical protein